MLMLSQYGDLCRDSTIKVDILFVTICYDNKIFPDPVYLHSRYLLIIKLFPEEKGEMSRHSNLT